jgi:predicted NUDIX family NTP pyrophosphohydrolase
MVAPATCRRAAWDLYFSMVSAGLLLYRVRDGALEVLLVHPGGPFWARKDRGAWSLPKGELAPGEAPEDAARREFTEETGFPATGPLIPLGSARQRGGKVVRAWGLAGDCDPAHLRSNSFELEWPPHSGTMRRFPEVDQAAWFAIPEARKRILERQAAFLDRLERAVG